ncbi:MAG: SCP-2 sterol transfer family protein [Gammaproteobacteria bacterium]|nr:SCP-2 sterol transfer family protein [Gammaproteobacteria bacterium]
MPELFSDDWATNYKDIWNSNEGIARELGQSNFSSVVAFGVDGEDDPRVVLTISNGQIVSAGSPRGESLNWDLRASIDEWGALVAKPPGLMKLGLAYTSRKLKFKKGDYAVMIKDPRLSTAFVKCFALMAKAIN